MKTHQAPKGLCRLASSMERPRAAHPFPHILFHGGFPGVSAVSEWVKLGMSGKWSKRRKDP
ncbi:MAG: hypothetical protein CW342_01930 [Thermoactinomycetaceae bacterium]|nr:hypothetical protein [Bacillota bacterium]MBO2531651.1 hypothetical protein [Thermoactinomycetaceae bacterium]